MYIIQVKKHTETYLLAICSSKHQATSYLATCSVELQAQASCYQIPIKKFPFIVIENTGVNHEFESYFEFCSIEELQIRLETFRKQKIDNPEHIYCNYYFIDEDYFQSVSDENYMRYMRHTVVTKDLLEQPYPVSVFHEEIKKCASNYNIDGLDQLFEQTKNKNTSKQEKEDLAINGYSNLFWEMNYDHACGKLTETGIGYLLPMVDAMEVLLGEKKWEHRSFAQHILLEQACKEASPKAHTVLKDTVEAFENYLISQPEEKLKIHRLLSLGYRWMMKAAPENAFVFLEKAILEIEKAIDFDPKKADWSLLLELIYTPFAPDKKISQAQDEAQKKCRATTQMLENKWGAVISYQIALAYQHLQEHLDWEEIENVFPETMALYWAEKSLAYTPEEITRMDLYECASFFNQIGRRTKRIDFLEKTISLYERAMKASADYALEIYYLANIWKEIAEIHIEKQQHELADKAIEQGKLLYENNSNQIKSNTSANLHYAQFLDNCYTYQGNIGKPTLSELKSIAAEIEIQSEGFLSYPYLLLMRIALYEKNEQQAILELTKSLILHECCADSEFEALIAEFEDTDFKELKAFLNETKSFMEEISENYYYNPEIKWKKMRTMPAEELIAYWKKRKEEIRNRPSFSIE